MTKKAVEKVIKRYRYVSEAIKKGLSKAEFYIGNRKEVVNITEEIKEVCNIIKIIYDEESDDNIKFMIKAILDGRTDINIIPNMPYEKNAYTTRKNAFMQKVYECCISRNLVSFEEILKEKIA